MLTQLNIKGFIYDHYLMFDIIPCKRDFYGACNCIHSCSSLFDEMIQLTLQGNYSLPQHINVCSGDEWSDHMIPALTDRLSAADRFNLEVATLVYRCLHGIAPTGYCWLPFVFSRWTAVMVQSLPETLRTAPSLSSFKRQLKTVLFSRHYSQ
jgi:hypothetical protein